MTAGFRTTCYLLINISYNLHNFYNESIYITDTRHPHNVLVTLNPVQQCFRLKKAFIIVVTHTL